MPLPWLDGAKSPLEMSNLGSGGACTAGACGAHKRR